MKFWRSFINLLLDIKRSLCNIELHSDLICKRQISETMICSEANESPIKKVTNESIILIEGNADRKNLIIQNIGVSPCYVKLGSDASLDDFHTILAADTFHNQGNGGSIELKNWHGEVYAICQAETKVSALEY